MAHIVINNNVLSRSDFSSMFQPTKAIFRKNTGSKEYIFYMKCHHDVLKYYKIKFLCTSVLPEDGLHRMKHAGKNTT